MAETKGSHPVKSKPPEIANPPEKGRDGNNDKDRAQEEKDKDRSIPVNTAAIVVHVQFTPSLGDEKSADSQKASDAPNKENASDKKSKEDKTRVEIQKIDDVFYEFRRRGFIVECCVSDDAQTLKENGDLPTESKAAATVKPKAKPAPINYWILVTLSPKLLVRLAVLRSFPVAYFSKYSPLQKLQLVQSGIELIMKAKTELFIIDAWNAHDPKVVDALFQRKNEVPVDQDVIGTPDDVRLKVMMNNKKKKRNVLIGKQLEAVYQYFGPQVAIYFGFLNYYTNALIIPSAVGAGVFIHQYFSGAIDTEYVPFFVVLLSIWSTWFLQSWKSKCSEYCYNWETFGTEELDLDRQLAKVSPALPVRIYFDYIC
jgi:hypothetical protein